MPVQRPLIGLVDDPHATPADLSDDPEVAPSLGRCRDVSRLARSLLIRDQDPQPGIPEELQPGQDRVARPVEPPGLFVAPGASIEVLGDLVQVGLGQLAQRKGEQSLRAGAGDPAHQVPQVTIPRLPALGGGGPTLVGTYYIKHANEKRQTKQEFPAM